MPPDLLIVRTFIVQFFVLRDGDALYLIDTGCIGGMRALERALDGVLSCHAAEVSPEQQLDYLRGLARP